MQRAVILLVLPFALLMHSSPPSEAQGIGDETIKGAVLIGKFEEAAALARKIKKFEKSLGITPTEALSKSSREGATTTLLVVYAQKRCTISFDGEPDLLWWMYLRTPPEGLSPAASAHSGDFSVFHRIVNEFGGKDSVITPDFLREPLWRKVETIIHEDLHGDENFALPLHLEEAVVSPLAYIGALRFAEAYALDDLAETLRSKIEEKRTLSRELLAYAKEVAHIFATLPCADTDIRTKAWNRISHYPTLKTRLNASIENLGQFEAALVLELRYWRYFERIMALHKAGKNFEELFALLKKAPEEESAFDAYLAHLADQLHASPTAVP